MLCILLVPYVSVFPRTCACSRRDGELLRVRMWRASSFYPDVSASASDAPEPGRSAVGYFLYSPVLLVLCCSSIRNDNERRLVLDFVIKLHGRLTRITPIKFMGDNFPSSDECPLAILPQPRNRHVEIFPTSYKTEHMGRVVCGRVCLSLVS